MKNIALFLYKYFWIILPTWVNCIRSGLSFNRTWNISGKAYVIKRKWYEKVFMHHSGGKIRIGDNFNCNNKVDSNSIGLIQPCVFNIALDGSLIEIGDNVGVSGSTVNAASSIVIENNVFIGSGCLITDTDSHPLNYTARINGDNVLTKTAPILIREGAFIGARSIIMKGVIVGRHSIVGAGSVVTKSIPDNCIACGNPAIVVRELKD